MSSKEENTDKKPPVKKEEKPVNPDLETCIRDKIAEGKSEEEARQLCEQSQDAPPEGQPSDKAPAPDPSGVEELPPEGAQPPQQQQVQQVPQQQPNPAVPPNPNQPVPPQGVPQDPNAPPQPGAFGQYQNFENCLQDQLTQGLVNKDAVVNCAAQLLQTLESQGMAQPMPPAGGGTYGVQGATIKVADFPGGFEECVTRFKSDGMEKDAAISKCETIFNAKINKAATAADYVTVYNAKDKSDKLYLRAFLLDPTVNVNDWGVSKASIDERIQTFVGRPLVLTEDFGHPELSDMTFGHALKYQDIYRIGTIVDVVQTAKDDFTKDQKVWYAICEVTDEKAKQAFREHKLPLYVSPAVAQMNIADVGSEINEWLGMHLALVDKPAFGIKKAMITGSCSGEKDKCVMHLRQAKIDQFGYGNCGFCVYGKLVSVLEAKTKEKPKVEIAEPKTLEKVTITPETVNSSQRAEKTTEQLTMSQQSTEVTKTADEQPKEEVKQAPQEFGLLDARLVKLETENTLLKEHLKIARTDADTLREENARLTTSIRRANIASIITAEVIPDEGQRVKTIDMFTEKGLTPDMVADLYATVSGNIKTAKESVYEPRQPLIKTAKASNDSEATVLSKEFRNMVIKGGQA